MLYMAKVIIFSEIHMQYIKCCVDTMQNILMLNVVIHKVT
jgi:hypothetical protein